MGKHPIISNVIIIILIAILGIWIVYLSFAIFTKHGQSEVVPKVENISYTEAINILHEKGFNVDIRDSLYKDNVRPGFVIEQFPKANSVVKPGRKIFLYINAVHPKEVVIDDNHNANEYALRRVSFRQGLARLQELGFKNIKVVKVLGSDDRIVKITANGRVVHNMERVPINARIVIEVSDGRLIGLRDSLSEMERQSLIREEQMRAPVYQDPYEYDPGYNPTSPSPASEREENNTESEDPDFF